ncbi:MAG TPA: hypothetical protein VE439_03990 [Anaerolineae bacterium]|jgi:hypothetical protein|nr:hypothetical protein [Anaerolineae bacterium]
MTKEWGRSLLVLGLIMVVVASAAIYGCTKDPTDATDCEKFDTSRDPWEEMRQQSTPFNIAVITQDKTWIPKLKKNRYPEVNKSAQFRLVLPEHVKAPIPADAVWVMKDQHEAALDTTTALHIALEQFARETKPVVLLGFKDTNKLARAFGDPTQNSPIEDVPDSGMLVSTVIFHDPDVPAVYLLHIEAYKDWDYRIRRVLESTWMVR